MNMSLAHALMERTTSPPMDLSGMPEAFQRAFGPTEPFEDEFGELEMPDFVPLPYRGNRKTKPRSRGSTRIFAVWLALKAQTFWGHVTDYIEGLKTNVLVLDEIQHVKSAGSKDRAAFQDFLKSLIQQSASVVVPVLIRMPSFQEVFVSDTQFHRRYMQVHISQLDPAVDEATAIRSLARYASAAELRMTKIALLSNADEIRIEHFEVVEASIA